jgi:Flp pilus assembly protein TadD
LKLWQDAAAKSRVNERPHMQYAVLLLEEGRYREAREALSTAQRINPFSSQIATMSRLFQSREVSR